jgi:multiple sugar transport system permease protein
MLMPIAGALIALFFLAPYVQMFFTAVKPDGELTDTPPSYLPKEWQWSTFTKLFSRHDGVVWDYFRSSLIIAVAATVVVMVVAVPAAYYVARHRFAWRTAFLLLIIVTQMIQPTSLVVGVIRTFVDIEATTGITLVGDYSGLILVNSVFNLTFAVWILQGFFAAIPAEIEEAAWTDGATKFTTMRKVTLPLAMPGLVTCVIFTFVAAWNEFAMARALVFGNRSRWPLTLGLSDFTQQYEDEWNYLFAASLIAILPVVVLFAAIERYLIKGLTAGAIK